MKYNKKTNPREYGIWKAMKARCYAPSVNKGHYKENNIQVCERWRYSFDNFIEDMGECPEGYSIDRKDNLGNYEPSNCRWATDDEQARNKSNNRFYTHDGETLCLKDWAHKLDIGYTTLHNRMFRDGHSFEEAISPDFGEIKKDNTSGRVGVSWHKGKQKWQAYGKHSKYLGAYDNYDDAVKAREQWEHENTTPTKAK